jgi:small subunit ribosomal protein S6
MAFYESTFIARQSLSAQDVQKMTDNFARIISEQGGKLVGKEYWGLRGLAYPIQSNRKGHYVLLNIDAPAAAVKELERHYGITEDVIRGLTVRVEALSTTPSPMLQPERYTEN